MEIDLFGIKLGKGSGPNLGNYQKSTEYKISKLDLCTKLGFQPEKVTYISYDYRAGNGGQLTIKVKN